MAEGTSFALPTPKPTTRACESPTTTRAEKLMFLPPLTTLVTRLIDTTCSFKFRVFGSMRFSSALNAMRLKLQSCFARRVGQCLHAAVIQVTTPVEHNFFMTRRLGPLGDQLADGLRAGDIAATLEAGGLLVRSSRHQRMSLAIVDDLRVNIRHAAEHSEARPLLRALDLAP